MKSTIATACLIAALAAPAFAQSSEGRALAETVFEGIDSSQRGYLDQGQFLSFGRDVFTSMDADENRELTLKEFTSWDFGMQGLAEDAGRLDAYDTALRVVFSFWDREGNGTITSDELNRSLKADFRRADLDENALLSKQEFTGGFSIMVALRAAINPAPIE